MTGECILHRWIYKNIYKNIVVNIYKNIAVNIYKNIAVNICEIHGNIYNMLIE